VGENPPGALVDLLSTELQVTANTPPTFIFHTQEDATVPVENALMYYSALCAAGVPGELHIHEEGPHGMGMRPPHAAALAWPESCATWMRAHGWLERY
jgi:dipeptidyl aminopeptidase/acylaminoacyl peptidase